MTEDVQAILQAAFVDQSQGRYGEAESACRRVLESHPGHSEATLLLGIVGARKGRPEEAIERFREVLGKEPEHGVARHWLSATLRDRGRVLEAAREGERAARLLPNDAEVFCNLGFCFQALGRNHDAAECLERAVRLGPRNPSYLYAFAAVLESAGRTWEAIQSLKIAVQVAPEAAGFASLAHLQLMSGDAARAIRSAQKALAIDARQIGAHLVLAEAYLETGQPELAEEHAGIAEAIDPAARAAYELARAGRLQFQGKIAEAHSSFERVMTANPRKGSAYFGWIATGSKGERQAAVERLEKALDLPNLPPSEASMLFYGLGRALEDLGNYKDAMERYDEANRLAVLSRPGFESFDLGALRASVDSTISLYSREFIESHQKMGSESELPLFVVGMIRSGTTLAEQILSCHSKIGGAGEHGFWTRGERRVVDAAAKAVSAAGIAQMCRSYCHMLQDIAPDKAFVIDKNPANFFVLGLIRIAFPKARIIHMRRTPIDTCLSIYTTPMQNPPDFALNKRNIVDGYRQYLRLMDHWRAALPSEHFLEVDYESLVTDRQETIRRMLEFCGVPFEEACLHPEANLKRVETPSFWQVRKPIHGESVGRWKHFEPWLGEFLELR